MTVSLEVAVTYRHRPLPQYTVWLRGYGAAGYGRTIAEAVGALVSELEEWVADLDIEADGDPLTRADTRGQRTLLRAVQQLLIAGQLRDALSGSAHAADVVVEPD